MQSLQDVKNFLHDMRRHVHIASVKLDLMNLQVILNSTLLISRNLLHMHLSLYKQQINKYCIPFCIYDVNIYIGPLTS